MEVNYEILKYKQYKIGAYGIIYLTYDNNIYKEFIDGYGIDGSISKSFIREISIMKTLSDIKSVVKIKEVYVNEDEIGYTMDHYKTILTKIIKSRVEEKYIKKIIWTILYTLYIAEQRAIIHRDIKPDNIFIDENYDIYIGDWGMSIRMDKGDNKLLRDIQTIWYRAPEILLYNKTYNSKIDIWSIGIIMLELAFAGYGIIGSTDRYRQLSKILSALGFPINEEELNLLLNISTPHEQIDVQNACGPNDPHMFNCSHGPIDKNKIIFIKECEVYSIDNTTLSPNGKDLLKKMLIFNPNKRISFEEALNHPYFKINNLTYNVQNGSNVFIPLENKCPCWQLSQQSVGIIGTTAPPITSIFSHGKMQEINESNNVPKGPKDAYINFLLNTKKIHLSIRGPCLIYPEDMTKLKNSRKYLIDYVIYLGIIDELNYFSNLQGDIKEVNKCNSSLFLSEQEKKNFGNPENLDISGPNVNENTVDIFSNLLWTIIEIIDNYDKFNYLSNLNEGDEYVYMTISLIISLKIRLDDNNIIHNIYKKYCATIPLIKSSIHIYNYSELIIYEREFLNKLNYDICIYHDYYIYKYLCNKLQLNNKFYDILFYIICLSKIIIYLNNFSNRELIGTILYISLLCYDEKKYCNINKFILDNDLLINNKIYYLFLNQYNDIILTNNLLIIKKLFNQNIISNIQHLNNFFI